MHRQCILTSCDAMCKVMSCKVLKLGLGRLGTV